MSIHPLRCPQVSILYCRIIPGVVCIRIYLVCFEMILDFFESAFEKVRELLQNNRCKKLDQFIRKTVHENFITRLLVIGELATPTPTLRKE